MRLLSLAVNVPGPVAAARLHQLGAAVIKVEPPAGDPLARHCPDWYAALCAGQQVQRLDLKDPAQRAELDHLLQGCDLLLTSSRPAALAGLGLDWASLHARYPRLAQVAIIGFPPPQQNVPGHDLTYLAAHGLLLPPRLPPTLMADLAGAERAVRAALGLLLARERGAEAGYAEVALATVAESFAAPLRHGLTVPTGLLGGGWPGYNLYAAGQGWVAVAALEPHFWERLQRELGLDGATYDDLAAIFATREAGEWEAWAAERDLPITALRLQP
jgi:crotonobetainyl-CoA:carnitine CoA-transferase CaiB-like acyl-CoA transferase